MKTSRLMLSVFAAFSAAAFVCAQPSSSAAKTPADAAAEAFFKLSRDRAASPGEARFDKLIGSGIALLATNPEHQSAPDVVFELAMFGLTMTDPKLAPYRLSYTSKLSTAIIDFRYKPELSPAAKTACAALDAGMRDYEARMQLNRDTLRALREKIDELAAMPDSGRYLAEREGSYVELITKAQGATAGERQWKKLLEHRDGAVAKMAQEKLNLLEVSKAPYQLKFTALDGKEFDVEKLRGKMVAVLFWSTGNEASAKSLAVLKAAHTKYRPNGLEVVGVSLDKAEDRDAVIKFVADKKLTWPTHFDGAGGKNEWIAKLNVNATPQLALFDQKGMLMTNNARMDRLDDDLKKLLGVKDPAPTEAAPTGGGKRR